jgi:hypothetical protein
MKRKRYSRYVRLYHLEETSDYVISDFYSIVPRFNRLVFVSKRMSFYVWNLIFNLHRRDVNVT